MPVRVCLVAAVLLVFVASGGMRRVTRAGCPRAADER